MNGPGENHTIQKVSPTGSVSVVGTGGLLSNPADVAVEPGGTLVSCQYGSNTVVRINPTNNSQTLVSKGGFINNPLSIIVAGFYVPSSRITGLSFSGTNVLVQFNTMSNYLHDVQAIGDLTAGGWLMLTNGLVGTGGPMTITDVGGATNSRRFYRVLLHY
jgi:DNA-binding beta-propeller fold protein YncE